MNCKQFYKINIYKNDIIVNRTDVPVVICNLRKVQILLTFTNGTNNQHFHLVGDSKREAM